MSIKPPITGDKSTFDRYLTENQYADQSGISRMALKVARRHLTEGEDWEHKKGGKIYWSKLGVDRLMRGMAISGGMVSARALAEATLATKVNEPSRTRSDPLPATLTRPSDQNAQNGVGHMQGGPTALGGATADLSPLESAPLPFPLTKRAEADIPEHLQPGYVPRKIELTEVAAVVSEVEPLPPPLAAVIVKLPPNPNLALVQVADHPPGTLTKVRIQAGSLWVVGDRMQVVDIGREVWNYVGRAPKHKGEFS